MRPTCFGIAGLVLALSLAGCGETVDEGPVTYKGTNTPEIQQALKQTSENAKNNKVSATKPSDDKSAGKKDSKEAEKKPAADTATDKKKD
jgi:hypothetical protein